jgi:hypothetical protein
MQMEGEVEVVGEAERGYLLLERAVLRTVKVFLGQVSALPFHHLYRLQQ